MSIKTIKTHVVWVGFIWWYTHRSVHFLLNIEYPLFNILDFWWKLHMQCEHRYYRYIYELELFPIQTFVWTFTVAWIWKWVINLVYFQLLLCFNTYIRLAWIRGIVNSLSLSLSIYIFIIHTYMIYVHILCILNYTYIIHMLYVCYICYIYHIYIDVLYDIYYT